MGFQHKKNKMKPREQQEPTEAEPQAEDAQSAPSSKKKKLTPQELTLFMSDLAQRYVFYVLQASENSETQKKLVELHDTVLGVCDNIIEREGQPVVDALVEFAQNAKNVTIQRHLVSYFAMKKEGNPALGSFMETGETLLGACGAGQAFLNFFVAQERSKAYPEGSPRQVGLQKISLTLGLGSAK